MGTKELICELASEIEPKLLELGLDNLLSFLDKKQELSDLAQKLLVPSSAKDEARALSLKVEGNAKFQQKRMEAAAQLYTKGLSLCVSEELKALLHCNRSACLNHLNDFAGAVSDAEHSLALNKSYAKAWYRLVDAEVKMGAVDDALSHIQEALVLDPTNASLQTLQETAKKAKKLSYGQAKRENREFFLSSKIETRFGADVGNHLVANAQIPRGEEILRELPFVCVLDPQFQATHCHACLRACHCLLPCAQCAFAMFCKACISTRKEEHAVECGVKVWQEVPLTVVLAFRALRRLQGGPELPDTERIRQLVSHSDKLSSTTQSEFLIYAALLQHCFQLDTQRIFELQAQIQCNVLAVTALLSDPLQSGSTATVCVTQKRVGLALYASASLLNHACVPNCELRFDGSQICVRTTQTLSCGDAVVHCYGPDARRMPTEQRQRLLQEQYFFDCHCVSCQSLDDGFRFTFECPRAIACPGPLRKKTVSSSDSRLECSSCGLCVDGDRLQSIIAAAAAVSAERKHLLQSLNSPGRTGTSLCRNFVSTVIPQATKLYYRKSPELASFYDTGAQALAECHSFEEAVVLCVAAMDILRCSFAEDSVEYAHEYFKLAQLQYHANRRGDAEASAVRARDVLAHCYSEDHGSVQEIDDFLGSL